jgi:nickel/cobalt transporter (NiCoT) family protein
MQIRSASVDGLKRPMTKESGLVAPSSIPRLHPLVRYRSGFTTTERARLAGFYGIIVLLHISGWGLFLYYSTRHSALVGLGFAAYMLGLRHAFDADHIAAVDDTVRYMLQKGKRPLGIGFFFSLGHSTIVFAFAVAIIFAAPAVRRNLPELQTLGGTIGAAVAGTFLWAIGILNLVVLVNILKVWRHAKMAIHSHAHLEELLTQRGLINRLLGGRVQKLINHSWQMYPLGLLFGLGFDTASEIGLLALTAGAVTGDLPVAAALSLPVLFAAGMSAMDTTDGVLMTKAYSWAFVYPLRKIFYNIAITTLSIAVALVIGTIELLQVSIGLFHLNDRFFDVIRSLDFGILGYVVVGMFLIAWGASVALWKFGRIEERYGSAVVHTHEHTHDSGLRQSREHFR